jgi:hypothetical protein
MTWRVYTAKYLGGASTKRESVPSQEGARHLADTYLLNDPEVEYAWAVNEPTEPESFANSVSFDRNSDERLERSHGLDNDDFRMD